MKQTEKLASSIYLIKRAEDADGDKSVMERLMSGVSGGISGAGAGIPIGALLAVLGMKGRTLAKSHNIIASLKHLINKGNLPGKKVNKNIIVPENKGLAAILGGLAGGGIGGALGGVSGLVSDS
jgi:hypothetical protein